jgi:RNA polymerase sigma-70 factor, ECF subfamily
MDFDTLYQRYARDVYRFALYLSGRPDEADDITAETFVRAWTSRQPIRVGTVKAYLFMIARNLYRAGVRARGRTAALEDTMPDPRPGPERSAADRRALEDVLARMQALPEIDRTVLLMRAHDDLTYEEIAAAVGISVTAAKVKVHHARARLARTTTKEEA